MKKTLLILPSLLLASCALPIPENEFVEGKAGFYKETSAFDPEGKPGIFLSRPAPVVVTPDKP